jgi:PAP2 superfamily
MKKYIVLVLFCFSITACKKTPPSVYNKAVESNTIFTEVFEKLTDVIIHDIFSPPVSSRIYAYTAIAGYEALAADNKSNLQALSGQLKDYTPAPSPKDDQEYCHALASATAMMTIARTLTFTVNKYDDFEYKLYKKFKDAGVPNDVFERSKEFGDAVAKHVLAFSKKDNYLQTRGLRYTVKNNQNKWEPTPPQYADAIEPFWMTIRPMVIDSASQFKPAPVITYSKTAGSAFRKELNTVYNTVKNLTKEQKDIAWFWDDNAFVMNVQGHVMFANKKMTPAGHWIAITKTLSKQLNLNMHQTAEAYLKVSLGLFDAFISCWHQKYASEKIRPETVINAEIDPKWQPFLQTPPFPEYTSGHSTISSASAEILTTLLGDNLAFTDSTEYVYDHGVRSFTSLRAAAKECSESRVYGGIHYKSGCDEGLKVGAEIGQYIAQKIKTRK